MKGTLLFKQDTSSRSRYKECKILRGFTYIGTSTCRETWIGWIPKRLRSTGLGTSDVETRLAVRVPT